VNKSQVDKQHPPVTIDHNLYYCESGSKASTWVEVSATVKGFDNYVQSTGNDRHSRFLDPRFVGAAANDFICDPIPPRLALVRPRDCRWENWILMAHRESNPDT
jgi:hypothetical protein